MRTETDNLNSYATTQNPGSSRDDGIAGSGSTQTVVVVKPTTISGGRTGRETLTSGRTGGRSGREYLDTTPEVSRPDGVQGSQVRRSDAASKNPHVIRNIKVVEEGFEDHTVGRTTRLFGVRQFSPHGVPVEINKTQVMRGGYIQKGFDE